jgi:hypothetical protein
MMLVQLAEFAMRYRNIRIQVLLRANDLILGATDHWREKGEQLGVRL